MTGFNCLFSSSASVSLSIFSLNSFCSFRSISGSMICVGRSNYFRFNHPEEAERMKTILPNARISSVPMNFANAPSATGIPSAPSATSPEPPGKFFSELSCTCRLKMFFSMPFKAAFAFSRLIFMS